MSELRTSDIGESRSARMSDYRELLIGCGRARDKRVIAPWSGEPYRVGERPATQPWRNLTTLDLNPHCGADLQCNLNAHPPWYAWQSSCIAHQLLSDYWDEIHAYEVLEHLGQQGDAASFFAQFSEIYRLLRPNGYLCATVPSRFSEGLWGDPSHRRAIVPLSLVFLDQEQYQVQIDRRIAARQCPTAMSDFRDTLGYRADFKLVDQHDNRTTFTFILQAVKPSRYRTRDEMQPLGTPGEEH